MMLQSVRVKRVIKLTLMLAFCYLLVSIASRHSPDEQQVLDRVERHILDAREQVKLRKLMEYQKVIFKNNPRPGNDVYNINITKAESMPLIRTDMPDSRPEGCSAIHYDRANLPTISVIVPFYNEALVMLLRTVHSVLEHTPEHLLVDVILVNDHSPNADLSERLPEYVKLLPEKVRRLFVVDRLRM